MTNDTEKPTTVECVDCHDTFGADDAGRCAECEKPLCDDCRRECDRCANALCRQCGEECAECGDGLCPDCREHCDRCGSALCEDDCHRCDGCGDRLCEDDLATCDGCGRMLCEDARSHCDRCGTVLCGDCTYWSDDEPYCEDCRPDEREPEYSPERVQSMRRHERMFTFGLEIEVNGRHDRDRLKQSPLIAGWCPDGSLYDKDGLEYQTDILTAGDLDGIRRLVESIHCESDEPGRAGGHMHVRRTSRQTPGRWYWALRGLSDRQARALNMRHATDCRWCRLVHGDYTGKAVAVNDNHAGTIELRTFARWDGTTAHRLRPALEWAHHMWRYFQEHEPYRLTTADIMRESAHSAYRTPETTPAMRLAARRED